MPGISGADQLGPTVSYQSPMTPGCVDWPWRGIKESLQPEAPTHWYALLRFPRIEGQPAPRVQAEGEPGLEPQVTQRVEPEALFVEAIGGPCDGPPLRLTITYPSH